MRSQPKLSRLSDKVAGAAPEVRREACQDEDGNPWTVLVIHPVPGAALTRYELEDGTRVNYVDDCLFEVSTTGVTLTRCP